SALGEFATCQSLCKEQFDVERGCVQRITRGSGNPGAEKKSSSHRSSAARSRDRIPIFVAWRPVVSCRKHDQSSRASRSISGGRRSPVSARRLVARTKPFLWRSRWVALSRQPGSRRDARAVCDHWTNGEDLCTCAGDDLWEQQSRDQFAARFCR